MPKAKLEFSLPEEQEEFSTAVRSSNMRSALWEISQRVFRPARKHGYPDESIQELLNKLGEDGEDLVSKLEKLFWEILEEEEIRNLP
jgi:hypothetical protein